MAKHHLFAFCFLSLIASFSGAEEASQTPIAQEADEQKAEPVSQEAEDELLTLDPIKDIDNRFKSGLTQQNFSDYVKYVWDSLTIYQTEDEEAFINSFRFIGRYHVQAWSVDSAQGDESGWDSRRRIIGFRSRFLDNYYFNTQMRIGTDFDPFYDGMHNMSLTYLTDDVTSKVIVGKTPFLFVTMERAMSSNLISTFERSMLINMILPPRSVVGAHYRRQFTPKYNYHFGLFSGDVTPTFASFDAGFVFVGGMSFNIPFIFEEGDFHFDYYYNDGHDGNDGFKPYRHVGSIHYKGEWRKFNFGMDFTYAHGISDTPNAGGFTLLANYDLVDRHLFFTDDALQLNFRYHVALSERENGLLAQKRYEQEIVGEKTGKYYWSVYGGLSYKLYGDRIKLMIGAEWSHLHGDREHNPEPEFEGMTYFFGPRMFF